MPAIKRATIRGMMMNNAIHAANMTIAIADAIVARVPFSIFQLSTGEKVQITVK